MPQACHSSRWARSFILCTWCFPVRHLLCFLTAGVVLQDCALRCIVLACPVVWQVHAWRIVLVGALACPVLLQTLLLGVENCAHVPAAELSFLQHRIKAAACLAAAAPLAVLLSDTCSIAVRYMTVLLVLIVPHRLFACVSSVLLAHSCTR